MLGRTPSNGDRCVCGAQANLAVAGICVCRDCMRDIIRNIRPVNMTRHDFRIWRNVAMLEQECEHMRAVVRR